MNSRERFQKTLNFDAVDRPPLFEDGIRQEVYRVWHSQGLGKREKLEDLVRFDYREEIEPDLDPLPAPTYWPKTMQGLKSLTSRLDPGDPHRLPDDWLARVSAWKTRTYPLILRLHRGYFLSMGVYGWHRFTDAIRLLVDDPKLVEAWMIAYSEFACHLAARILGEVQVDAVLFSEPIGGNHGPLISPVMYSSFVLKSYRPILDFCKSHGIDTLIFRTYANTRALLPAVVEAGFNCLWACESNPEVMDYREIRREFGNDLSLIGGIDADALRQGKAEIYQAVMDIVPPLLAGGGFIPLADGRVREDVTFENYLYYRQLLEQLVAATV